MEQFWSFFSFPLNVLLALPWLVSWGLLWKNHKDCAPIRFLLSPAATISSLVILGASLLWIGLSGDRDFVQSIPFVLLLLYVQTVVYLVTLRGWKRGDGVVRWRFLIIHAGFLLAAGSAFWGAPDSSELRVILKQGQESASAYRMNGQLTALGYDLHLESYKVDLSEDGKPSYYEAIVNVDDAYAQIITVNNPLSISVGEDIYLVSISDSGCVFQIVREPWRYFALAGILMLIAGAFMLFIRGPKK